MLCAQRFISTVTALSLCGVAGMQPARAANLITAEEVAVSQGVVSVAGSRAQLLAALARDDVAAALAERGVSVAQARARAEALTDAEAAQLMAGIDQSPAGASELLGTVVLVAVLLVFTDILGFTRIFPFLRPAR